MTRRSKWRLAGLTAAVVLALAVAGAFLSRAGRSTRLVEPAPGPAPRADGDEEPARRQLPTVAGGAGRETADSATQNSETEATARFTVLSLEDLAPVDDVAWRLAPVEPPAPETFTVTTDALGRAAAHAGRWRIECVDDRYTPTSPEVELRPGESNVVWVQPNSTRAFVVRSTAGAPVRGARVAWLPGNRVDRSEPRHGFDPPHSATTDEAGRATLASCPCLQGRAVVSHQDFEPVTILLSGSTAEVVEVRLRPAHSTRVLHFVTLGDREPVLGVELRSVDGHVVARADDDRATVELASAVADAEPLWASSDRTLPCLLQLREIDGEEVALTPSRTVEVEVVSGAACPKRFFLTVHHAPLDELRGVEPLVGPGARRLRGGAPVPLDLPLGVTVTLSVNDECGGYAETSLEVDRATQRVVLNLGEVDCVVVHALDRDGRPVPGARASGLRRGIELPADDDGRLRIPRELAGNGFTLSADGYRSVKVNRNVTAVRSGGDEHVTVALPTAVAARLRVESESGQALPGMRVRVSPVLPPFRAERDQVWVVDRVARAVTGITDGLGELTLVGVAEGPARVAVDLPPEVAADPFARSGYPMASRELDLQAEDLLRVVVPRPVHRALRVVDATSGDPVTAFELRPDAGSPPMVEITGGLWEGWLSSAIDTVVVSADGFGPGLARVADWPGDEVQVVSLAPMPAARVRLVGLPEGVSVASVDVVLRRRGDDGAWSYERAVTTEVAPDGTLTVDVGVPDDVWIGIEEVELDGRTLDFRPNWQRYSAGEVLRFECGE